MDCYNNKVTTSLTNGAAEFEIAFDSATAATADGKLTITSGAVGTAKAPKAVSVTLKMKNKTYFDNVKSIKQTGKLNAAKDAVELNVPLGSSYNLGVSVNPVTADNKITYNVSRTAPASGSCTPGTDYSLIGDVFVAKTLGDFTITAVSNAHSEKMATVNMPVPYKIHVYNPGGAIVWEDYSTPEETRTEGQTTTTIPAYNGTVIRGGFLVKDNDETVKTIASDGKVITIKAPKLTGASGEDVVWTSSNPAGLNVQKNSDPGKLDLKPLVAGTYNVSGVSTITKQKFSFKVLVGSNLTKDNASTAEGTAKIHYIRNGVDTQYTDGDSAVQLRVGDTIQAYLDTSATGVDTGYSAARISYSVTPSTESKNVTVKNGLIKAAGITTNDATVTFTMDNKLTGDKQAKVTKTIKIEVKPAEPSVVIKTPNAYITKGAKINPSSFATITNKSSKAVTVKWYYVECDVDRTVDGEAVATPVPDSKKMEVVAGTYKVYPVFTGNVTNKNNDGAKYTLLTVYDYAPSALAIGGEATSSTYSNSKYAFSGKTLTVDNDERGITVPISVTPAVKGKDVDVDEIIWTSGNVNIATVVDKSNEIGSKSNENYAKILIEPTGIVGNVVITGVSKNGNKKLAITLKVTNDKTKVDKFDTTKFTWDDSSEATTKDVQFKKAKDTKVSFTLTAEYDVRDTYAWTKDTANKFFSLAVKEGSTAITENVPFKVTKAVWGVAAESKRKVTLTVEYAKPAGFTGKKTYTVTPSYIHGQSASVPYTVTIKAFGYTDETPVETKYEWGNDQTISDVDVSVAGQDSKEITVTGKITIADDLSEDARNTLISDIQNAVKLMNSDDTSEIPVTKAATLGTHENNEITVTLKLTVTKSNAGDANLFGVKVTIAAIEGKFAAFTSNSFAIKVAEDSQGE